MRSVSKFVTEGTPVFEFAFFPKYAQPPIEVKTQSSAHIASVITIVASVSGIIVSVIHLVFQKHGPCLLQDNPPTTVHVVMTHVDPKFPVIPVDIIPGK